MSGNPFRRKDNHATTSTGSDIDRTTERFPALSINASGARSSPKPKTVRIASPEVPISPYSAYYFSDSSPSSPELSRHPTRSESPPKQDDKAVDEEASPIDPFNPDGSDGEEEAPRDEEDTENTPQNISSTNSTTPTSPKDPHQDVPSDPVQSTLSRFARRLDNPKQSESRTKPTLPRQTMDVDAFKNLLLTGIPTKQSNRPPFSPADPTPPSGLPHASDSSSNTDTASISRASIFEPSLSNPPLSPDTPRSSHELSPEDADDERARLVSSDSASLEPRKKGAPPPAPKTRHGKRISSDPPQRQTSQTQPQSQISPAPPTKKSPPSAANLNKPLPQPPYQDPWATVTPVQEPPGEMTSQIGLTNVIKRPPTPPLTRRKSHRGVEQSESQSQSQNVSRTSSVCVPSDSSSHSTVMKPPPTPPTRRSTSHRSSIEMHRPPPSLSTSTDLPPSTNVGNTFSPPLPTAAVETETETETATRPPLPPPTRQSSTSISTSTSTSASAPASTPLRGAPVPPPPRRARGSSRSSWDMNAPSTSASGAAEMGGAGEEAEGKGQISNASDILKDLEKLKWEVDEARRGAGG